MDSVAPKRDDHRIIIHFDYDCFYAAVFEREDPSLASLPLAVQQKQIIVTCNYEARRRGLHKLQLVREAREKCPDVIIVLGEDLTRFRNASKDNYNFLRSYLWSNRIEKLGFDEVFMDVTDIVDYNIALVNPNNPSASFFHLDPADPTFGFSYNASTISGHAFPPDSRIAVTESTVDSENILPSLCLGSHLAQHLRHLLEEHKGYTSTVGVSTNKLLSKLVGNVNKPRGQTTLLPPYLPCQNGRSHVNEFIDDHDIGKIPGIGFKVAQKIRSHVLGRRAAHEIGLVYGGTKENVKAGDVRLHNGMGPTMLEKILAGPGVPKDLPGKVWDLINGVDDAEVGKGREVPQQISIEDSYIRLDELTEVRRELKMLTISLIKRMRVDLTSSSGNEAQDSHLDEEEILSVADVSVPTLRWIAHPQTLRLSTRPRPPLNPDGTRSRTFARISKSGPMPTFIFSLSSGIEELSDKLLDHTLMPLFRKLHPEKCGWNLSLVNICATNMAMTASDAKDGAGRDISVMFKQQDDVLKDWKVDDIDISPPSGDLEIPEHSVEQGTSVHREDNGDKRVAFLHNGTDHGSEDFRTSTQESNLDIWDSEGEDADVGEVCHICGAIMPAFAKIAHNRFHDLPQ